MKFCIKSETTFERRREKKGKNFWRRHLITYTMVLCPYKKFWQKNTTNPREQSFSNPLKPYSHQEYNKKQKPLIITRAKKWCVPSGGKSLLVLFAKVSSVGLKTTLWVCGTLLPKKTRFSKKKSKNLIGCHLSRSFSLLLLGD